MCASTVQTAGRSSSMAESRLHTAILLFIFLPCMAETDERNPEELYVSVYGHDSEDCGPLGNPCRSIAWAVNLVDWSGRIYLDGNGTEQQPFDCAHQLTRGRHPGIFINKNVSIEGFRCAPHVSCAGGIHFRQSTARQIRTVMIVLSGISFMQTPLTFDDCSHVQLFNCSLKHSPTALRVRMKQSSRVQIDIQGSLFRNNSRCVEILLFKNISQQDRFLTINVKETDFHDNGLHGEMSARDVISIKTNAVNSTRVSHIEVSCYKVTCLRNNGSFLNLSDATALTKETYKNITMVNNCFTTDTEAGENCPVDSMYVSRAWKTRVSFVNLRCANNGNGSSVRCINIQSEQAVVTIVNSSFFKQFMRKKKGAALSLETQNGASLAVFNTTFVRNGAFRGGAVFVNSQSGTLRLNFDNVNFTSCTCTGNASAILISEVDPSLFETKYDLYAKFKKVQIKECKDNKKYQKFTCGSMCIIMKSGNVSVEESSFVGNFNRHSAVLFVGSTGGKTNVNISGSTLIGNHVGNKNSAVIRTAALKENAGSVTITNVIMIKNKFHAVMITPKYIIKLVNVTVTLSRTAVRTKTTWWKSPTVFPVNISIYNSTFVDNANDLWLTFHYPSSIYVKINNTNFTGRKQRGQAIRAVIHSKQNVTISNTAIELDTVTFDSRPSTSFALFFQGNKTLTIRRSIFRNCISVYQQRWHIKANNFERETCSGAISILNSPDHLNSDHNASQSSTETYPIWDYESHVIFQDTLFLGNAGGIAGAVYLSNGNTTFINCTFQDNFASHYSGQVYSAYGSGRVEFKNCSFRRTLRNITANSTSFTRSAFLYAESEGPIRFRNTNMSSVVGEMNFSPVLEITNGGLVEIDKESTIQCSEGSRLWLENTTHFRGVTYEKETHSRINVAFLKYSCKLCPAGSYSLQRGMSRGLAVDDTFICLPCAFGATCVHTNIAAKPNFWGFPNPENRSSLQFISCPADYCQTPHHDSALYNSCHGNRDGDLCGQCAGGFTETILSTECRRVSECGDPWLWILMIIYSTGLALFLLKKPPITHLLKKQIFWFKRKEECVTREDQGRVPTHSADSGYLKITFYFYQAAELLIVGSPESLLRQVPFINFVVAAFNFQVRTINKGIGCPFAGLTVVTKELFLSFMVLVTMANVALMYLVHFAVNLIRGKQKPPLIHYIAVVIEILLLGYERLAETSLKLMHCVSIGSESRLFVDGSIQCWQWWQFLLLAYIAVFVVPFIAVLYCGSLKLYNASLSASGFIGACIFPLPFLLYWLVTHIIKRGGRDKPVVTQVDDNEDVLEILHGPFRLPDDHDQGTLYWESVLTGRRFIFLSFHAFIADSMLRMVCMTAASVLMTVHHLTKHPYRDPMANNVESLSLTTLVVIASINLTKATLLSSGVSPEGPIKRYLEGFQWFEICALGIFPALICVLAAFAILSQLVRLVMFLTSHILSYSRQTFIRYLATKELRRPLLEDSM